MRKHRSFWLIAALSLPLSWWIKDTIPALSVKAKPPAQAKVMNACRVLRIHDGDTLKIRCGIGSDRQRELKVRLYCIDAPELAQQPWGKISRAHLHRLVGQGPVQLRVKDKDAYGRTVGEVWRGGKNLNLAMVNDGKVAVYRQYCKVTGYYQAEKTAKSRRLGIWARPGSHQRPWEWRY